MQTQSKYSHLINLRKKNLPLSLHYNYLTRSGNRKTETNRTCVRVCLAHGTKTGTQKTQLARGLAVFVSHYKLLSCVCVFMAEKTQTNPASVPWSIKLWLILPVMWKQRVYKMASRDRGVIWFRSPGKWRLSAAHYFYARILLLWILLFPISHSLFDLDVTETWMSRNFSKEFYHATRNQIFAQPGWPQPTAEMLPFFFSMEVQLQQNPTGVFLVVIWAVIRIISFTWFFFFYRDTSLQPCDGLEPLCGIDTYGIASGQLETADV